jgi:competence protein ComEA
VQPHQLAVGGLALLVAIGSGVWFGAKPAEPAPMVVDRSAEAAEATPSQTLTVHVSGAVAHPGLVELVFGARVADALAGAGGALGSADLTLVNLAAPVLDGALIVVPAEGTPPTGWPADSGGLVRVNTASVEQLTALPGIGPVLAQRIADHRDEFGPFGVVEDLLDVPGIGEAKLAGLRDAVVVP